MNKLCAPAHIYTASILGPDQVKQAYHCPLMPHNESTCRHSNMYSIVLTIVGSDMGHVLLP